MIRFAVIFGLLASPVTAASPIADIICEPTDRMHTKLTRQYGASREATGVQSPEQIMEVWTGDQGDWTLVITYATGTSCIVAMGQHWAPTDDPA